MPPIVLDTTAYDIETDGAGPFFTNDGTPSTPADAQLDLVVDDDFVTASLAFDVGTTPTPGSNPMTEITGLSKMDLVGPAPTGKKKIRAFFTLPPTLENSSASITFTGTDAVDNVATTTAPILVEVDRTAPTVTFTLLTADGGKLSTKPGHRTLKFTIVVPSDVIGCQVRCRLMNNSSPWTDKPGVDGLPAGPFSFTDPADGSEIVVAQPATTNSQWGEHDGEGGFTAPPSPITDYMTVVAGTEYLFVVDMRDVVAAGCTDTAVDGKGTQHIIAVFAHDNVGNVNQIQAP